MVGGASKRTTNGMAASGFGAGDVGPAA